MIKKGVMALGSAATGFTVYEDFMHYKGGVYSHTNTSQKMLGGHAVKIVGWGVQNASTVNGTTVPEQE